ncbi:hypothetical protein Tco_0512742, partial [Tanacetum coccineum]
MTRTNVGRGGRGGRGGGRDLSDHAAARGWGQRIIWTNTSSAHSKKNATMSSDTRVQIPVGEDEPNTDVFQHRKGSNIIEQVPH